MEQLRKHFLRLKEKYRSNTRFSAMYVKFVFSNVIQALFQEEDFEKERCLEKEIDRLYGCSDIIQILDITEENICAYGAFLEKFERQADGRIELVKREIRENCGASISLSGLSGIAGLPAGYLCFMFRRKAGMDLPRFIHVTRMEKARRLLEDNGVSPQKAGEACGFACQKYFLRSFRTYFGKTAEDVMAHA